MGEEEVKWTDTRNKGDKRNKRAEGGGRGGGPFEIALAGGEKGGAGRGGGGGCAE